eukprot:tig00001278_g7988.t1
MSDGGEWGAARARRQFDENDVTGAKLRTYQLVSRYLRSNKASFSEREALVAVLSGTHNQLVTNFALTALGVLALRQLPYVRRNLKAMSMPMRAFSFVSGYFILPAVFANRAFRRAIDQCSRTVLNLPEESEIGRMGRDIWATMAPQSDLWREYVEHRRRLGEEVGPDGEAVERVRALARELDAERRLRSSAEEPPLPRPQHQHPWGVPSQAPPAPPAPAAPGPAFRGRPPFGPSGASPSVPAPPSAPAAEDDDDPFGLAPPRPAPAPAAPFPLPASRPSGAFPPPAAQPPPAEGSPTDAGHGAEGRRVRRNRYGDEVYD